MGTQNKISNNGKEQVFLRKFEKAKFDILAITEIKKKEQGMSELNSIYRFLYSGVKPKKEQQKGQDAQLEKIHKEYGQSGILSQKKL